MPTDQALLTLVQWLSPAYPTGAFAWSHGLESAIADGRITDARTLQDWLTDIVTDGTGRADATWIALAHAADDPLTVGAEARAFAASAERIREADRQGTAFAQTTAAVWGLNLPPMLLPVAIGRAARLIEIDAETTAAVYLTAMTQNLASAAQRLMPLGQTAAQATVAALAPLCRTVAADAVADPEPFSNTLLSDIAAMRHETLEPRLFQS